MKYTVLQMVQNIAASMNSDEVNSISDNAESSQIATICETVFYDMASELNLPEHYSIFQLLPSLDTSKPTIMYRPDNVHKIDWIKYNAFKVDDPEDDTNSLMAEHFVYLQYLPLEQFFDFVHQLDVTQDNVSTFEHIVNGDSFTLYCRNDIAPTYYSTFDDNTIIFDAYDSAVDDTLQKNKTLASGPKSQIFNLTDTFVPPFDEQIFALYYNECKALAWFELRESQHGKAEQMIKRQRRSVQKNKDAFATKRSQFDRLPNYGRSGIKGNIDQWPFSNSTRF